MDPALPWLWGRPAVAALMCPLAWEPPYVGCGPKNKTDKQTKTVQSCCPACGRACDLSRSGWRLPRVLTFSPVPGDAPGQGSRPRAALRQSPGLRVFTGQQEAGWGPRVSSVLPGPGLGLGTLRSGGYPYSRVPQGRRGRGRMAVFTVLSLWMVSRCTRMSEPIR